ncbi:MAG: hypothetical protein AB7O73_08395 [Bacteroidia bacterium]
MSRHFNYELDEKKIRFLMKDISMSYDDAIWNELVEKSKPIAKETDFTKLIPINFEVSRNTILTILFIIVIGSSTLLIAKFVDFSDKNTSKNELREVIPTIQAKLPEEKMSKPVAEVVDTIKSEEDTIVLSPNSIIITNTTEIVNNQSSNSESVRLNNSESNSNNTPPTINQPIPNKEKDTSSNKSGLTERKNNQSGDSTNISVTPKKKSKKKKKEAEIMEQIQTLPELPSQSEEEPELKLR